MLVRKVAFSYTFEMIQISERGIDLSNRLPLAQGKLLIVSSPHIPKRD